MTTCDVLIVGGGPAGSTCARALRQAGWDVIVLDRARFPRDKVCAGWITPEVFQLLDLGPQAYRDTGLVLQEITAFRTGLLRSRSVETAYDRVVSYAIRRCEFDDLLLRRSGARVLDRCPLTDLRRAGGDWIVNDVVRAPMVIGAGGHFCPVARRLRRAAGAAPVVAREAEVPLTGQATSAVAGVPELYFCDDLEGYAWCVRKGEYLNIGMGRRTSAGFNAHVEAFARFLEQTGKVSGASQLPWRGHAYRASGIHGAAIVGDGVMLVGDAAGLAYPESGEGIRPAIESSLVAARTLIAARGRHTADDLLPYQAAVERAHPEVKQPIALVRSASKAIGRRLLGSRAFTRHILLDRWFLRAGSDAATRPPGEYSAVGSR